MFNVNKIDEANLIAIDTETYDPNLKTMGPGGFRKDGFIAGKAFLGISNNLITLSSQVKELRSINKVLLALVTSVT